MEGGYLDTRAGGALEVRFSRERPSFWEAKGDKLFYTMRMEKATVAYRCPKCRVVVFEY